MKQICFTHHSDHNCLFVILKLKLGIMIKIDFVETAIFDKNGKLYYCNADNLREVQFFLLNILALFCLKRILSQKNIYLLDIFY